MVFSVAVAVAETIELCNLVIYNPAVGRWSSSKWHEQNFEPPSQSQKILFDPPHIKYENFLIPLNLNGSPYNQATKKFSTPLKRNLSFSKAPTSRVLNFFDPPQLSTTPYCWVKNDQPLRWKTKILWLLCIHIVRFSMKYWISYWFKFK